MNNPQHREGDRSAENPNAPQGAASPKKGGRFNYNDLTKITQNFKTKIGDGGFGLVYMGNLENGTLVAVKKRSQSTSQGVREFVGEAEKVTKIHHKNLVSLIGYCQEGDYMGLVYEYMDGGTLKAKLEDTERPLTWKQRLQIAYESAQGLNYLHTTHKPPIIHRDLSTIRILLQSNREAKITDFGFSNYETSSQVTTAIVGTPGYVDPEYHETSRLTEKSDVFSFGVILLQIVTGQPPILGGRDGGNISRWVANKLLKGETIIDQGMQDQFDKKSVQKFTDLAQKCTKPTSSERPTMEEVVAELKESLDLEILSEGTRTTSTAGTSQYPD